jgi:peptidoglycan/xylan/chitin deacetylase (PgdA/CDA1 family)
VGILTAHGVHEADGATPIPPPTSSMSMSAFANTVLSLARKFHFVSMDEAVAMINGQAPWRRGCLALTFDDSLKCLAGLAAPWLARHGIPATFYISTDAIERGQPYWWIRLDHALNATLLPELKLAIPRSQPVVLTPPYPVSARKQLKPALKQLNASECDLVVTQVEGQTGVRLSEALDAYPPGQIMSWDDACRLRDLGMTVGSHSVSHPNLKLLDGAALRAELVQSRQHLERQLGVACRHFSYPFGAHSSETCRAAQEAGYGSAVTTREPAWNQVGDDPFRLRRLTLTGAPAQMSYHLSGWNYLLHSSDAT